MTPSTMTAAELAAMMRDAANGTFPDSDFSLRVAPLCGPAAAVVAFTGMFVVAGPVTPAWVEARMDGMASPLHPRLLLDLAERLHAPIGENDAVLAASPLPNPPPLRLRRYTGQHPRLLRARRYRDDLRAWSTLDGTGLLVLGRGLTGRNEMSIDVTPHAQGHRLGRRLATAARSLAPDGEPVFAQVTPGNAASLRCLLAAGYCPVAQEVLFTLRPNPPAATGP